MTRAAALLESLHGDTGGSIMTATFDALDHPAGFSRPSDLLDATARSSPVRPPLVMPGRSIVECLTPPSPGLAMVAFGGLNHNQRRLTYGDVFEGATAGAHVRPLRLG